MPRSSKVKHIYRPTNLEPEEVDLWYAYHGWFTGKLEEPPIQAPPVYYHTIALTLEETRGRSLAAKETAQSDYRVWLLDGSIPLSYRLLRNVWADLYISYVLDEIVPVGYKRKPRIKTKKSTRQLKPLPKPLVTFLEKYGCIRRFGKLAWIDAKPLDKLGIHDRVLWDTETYEVLFAGNIAYCQFMQEYFSMLYKKKRTRIDWKETFTFKWNYLLKHGPVYIVYKNDEVFITSTLDEIQRLFKVSEVSEITERWPKFSTVSLSESTAMIYHPEYQQLLLDEEIY